MNILQSIILGFIQGASEFLPISSSAHLILFPWLFGFRDPGLSFDVALHFGTLMAVIAYFQKDWREIFKMAVRYSESNMKKEMKNTTYSKKFIYFLILATIPGVLAGYLLEDYAESIFRSPLLIAFTLAIVGLALYIVDKYHRHRRSISEISWFDGLVIGISQALAIIPGVSRSGATITAGLWRGLSRESAARFSFLLSTPIILGAAVKQFPDFFEVGITLPVLAGIFSSAVSGFFAIKYLLKFVEKKSYAIFFWYRFGLAGIIILFTLFR